MSRPSRCFPTVDVIVPVYNACDDVLKCISSLIEKTDILHRVIIINDGDEELDLLDGFSSKSKYQKWCRGIIDIESLLDDKKNKSSQPVQTSLF